MNYKDKTLDELKEMRTRLVAEAKVAKEHVGLWTGRADSAQRTLKTELANLRDAQRREESIQGDIASLEETIKERTQVGVGSVIKFADDSLRVIVAGDYLCNTQGVRKKYAAVSLETWRVQYAADTIEGLMMGCGYKFVCNPDWGKRLGGLE